MGKEVASGYLNYTLVKIEKEWAKSPLISGGGILLCGLKGLREGLALYAGGGSRGLVEGPSIQRPEVPASDRSLDPVAGRSLG